LRIYDSGACIFDSQPRSLETVIDTENLLSTQLVPLAKIMKI
jgi:hypothetical protein